jgi:6-phosphofructokinase 2
MYFAGGYTGIVLQNLLKAEGLETLVINTGVEIGENIMIVDRSTNLQYRFITPGNSI